MNKCCQQLDDYLDGDLTAPEQAAWRMLASDCPHCREALRQQAEVDEALRAAWNCIEPPTEVTVETLPHRSWKEQGRWAGLWALALLLLIGALVLSPWLIPVPKEVRQDQNVVSQEKTADVTEQPITESTSPETVVSSGTSIVVPLVSEPHYTIVQVLPEFKRPQPSDRTP